MGKPPLMTTTNLSNDSFSSGSSGSNSHIFNAFPIINSNVNEVDRIQAGFEIVDVIRKLVMKYPWFRTIILNEILHPV